MDPTPPLVASDDGGGERKGEKDEGEKGGGEGEETERKEEGEEGEEREGAGEEPVPVASAVEEMEERGWNGMEKLWRRFNYDIIPKVSLYICTNVHVHVHVCMYVCMYVCSCNP